MTEPTFTLSQLNWSTFLLDGGAMFGIIPRPLWARLIPPDQNNGIRLAMRSLVIRGDDRVVLVDCGMWSHFPDKLRNKVYAIEQPPLEQTLREQAGLALDDVTDIIASHLHFDHVGGFAAADGEGHYRAAFPNARLHVQKAQLEWAQGPSRKDGGSYVKPLVDLIARHDRLVLHEGPWQLARGLEIDVVDGHTRAMQITRVRHGDSWVIHTADMIPTAAHVAIPYIMAYDNEPLLTAAEKERFYNAYPDAIYFFEHDPENPFCTITRDDRGHFILARCSDCAPPIHCGP